MSKGWDIVASCKHSQTGACGDCIDASMGCTCGTKQGSNPDCRYCHPAEHDDCQGECGMDHPAGVTKGCRICKSSTHSTMAHEAAIKADERSSEPISGDANQFQGKRIKSDAFHAQEGNAEIGWLIERRENPEYLFVPEWAGFGWTPDPLKAIRFARRDDAEQVLKMLESEDAWAAEHQWG